MAEDWWLSSLSCKQVMATSRLSLAALISFSWMCSASDFFTICGSVQTDVASAGGVKQTVKGLRRGDLLTRGLGSVPSVWQTRVHIPCTVRPLINLWGSTDELDWEDKGVCQSRLKRRLDGAGKMVGAVAVGYKCRWRGAVGEKQRGRRGRTLSPQKGWRSNA